MAQTASQVPTDSQLLNLKLPPHSIDAEQSVLGGLLIDNGAFDKVGDVLADSDFYRDDHRRIFRQISRLIERGKPADVVTVDEAIKASEDKDKTGGAAYLGALAQNTPSALNIRRYAELVRERAVQRRLAQVATEIAEGALGSSGKDVGQLLDEAESKIFQIAESGARRDHGLQEIKPVLARVFERGLTKTVGYVLPVEKGLTRWLSEHWKTRSSQLFLLPGDSAIGFSGMEMETLVRYGFPVKIVVLNNGGIGPGMPEIPENPMMNLKPNALIYGARYDKMMEAFGGKGYFVEDPKKIRGALDDAMKHPGPTLVNIVISQNSARKAQQFAWHS